MNITPIKYNSNIYGNTNKNINNQNVSFCAKKQVITETVKTSAIVDDWWID